jgi:hypothetical protein
MTCPECLRGGPWIRSTNEPGPPPYVAYYCTGCGWAWKEALGTEPQGRAA